MERQNVYVIDDVAPRASRGPAPDDAAGTARSNERGNKQRPPATAGTRGGLPRLGASCSMVLCGSGHLLHRRWASGTFYLLALAGALVTPFVLRLAWPRLDALVVAQGLGERDLLVGLLLLDVLFTATLLAGVYTAYALGRARGGNYDEVQAHPAGAAAASLLVPGWGQIVNGQIGKALAFLAVVYAGGLAAIAWMALPEPIERLLPAVLGGVPATLRPAMIAGVAFLIGGVTWALSLYDAVLVARYRRKPRRGR
ncbi:MAG: hypothetical protein PVJ49_21220 [Acidobacteriota bacterium]|jgi:hypothetical protein